VDASAFVSDGIGIYFDEAATGNCLDDSLLTPLTAYLILRNATCEAGVSGWEGRVGWDPGVYVSLQSLAGGGTNFATFPEFAVGIGTAHPLPFDTLITLAAFQVFATSPGGVYFKGRSGQSSSDPDRPQYAAGDDPADLVMMSYSYGSPYEHIATLGGLPCPVENATGGGDVSLPDSTSYFSVAQEQYGYWDLRHAVRRKFSRGTVLGVLAESDLAFVGEVLDAEAVCREVHPRLSPGSDARVRVRVTKTLRGHPPTQILHVLVREVSSATCARYVNGVNPDAFIVGREYVFLATFTPGEGFHCSQGRVLCVEPDDRYVACQPNVEFEAGLRDSFTNFVEHAAVELDPPRLARQASVIMLVQDLSFPNMRPLDAPCVARVVRVLKGRYTGNTVRFTVSGSSAPFGCFVIPPLADWFEDGASFLLLLEQTASGLNTVANAFGLLSVAGDAILSPHRQPMGRTVADVVGPPGRE
jgi:hypothetical protein